MQWIGKKIAREEGELDNIEDYEDDDDWTIHGDIEIAKRMFSWLQAIEWRHLPNEGGLLDQDECLMSDIFTLLFREREFKEHKKVNEAGY